MSRNDTKSQRVHYDANGADRDEWDCGCQWEDCWQCGGDGCHDLYEEDPIAFAPGESEECDVCDGAGGWVAHSCHGDSGDIAGTKAEVRHGR